MNLFRPKRFETTSWLLMVICGIVSVRAALIPPAVKVRNVSGRIQFLLRDAQGKPTGIVLRNRAVVLFNPESLHDASPLAVGDSVDVRGYPNMESPNTVIQQASITESGHLVLDEMASPNPPPPAGFDVPSRFSVLKKTILHAKVFALVSRGNGDLDRIVLNDGTFVQVSSGGLLDKKNLKLGSPVTVSGLGTDLKSGRFVQAMSIKDQKQFQQIIVNGANQVHQESWVTMEGKVSQTLLTPRGLVNGVVLSNHSAIRFRPVPPEDVSRLKSGAFVEASGPGKENQVFAGAVLMPRQGSGLSTLPLAKQPHPEPSRDLDRMIDRGQILTVLKDPYGDVEALVLTDGTSVQVPPDVRRGLDFYPRAGETITLEGYGGKYAEGSAILASSLRRDITADQTS